VHSDLICVCLRAHRTCTLLTFDQQPKVTQINKFQYPVEIHFSSIQV
jgi:hypothetical protein